VLTRPGTGDEWAGTTNTGPMKSRAIMSAAEAEEGRALDQGLVAQFFSRDATCAIGI
jgi:hypothetical protein